MTVVDKPKPEVREFHCEHCERTVRQRGYADILDYLSEFIATVNGCPKCVDDFADKFVKWHKKRKTK